MKTNEAHVRQACRMFTKGQFDELDLYCQLLRTISMTEGKGPLTHAELCQVFTGQQQDVVLVFLKDAISENIVEHVPLNGVLVYKHTKYFEDLVFWQKVKAGLIERPAK